MGMPTSGTPASGTPASGTPASGTPASGTPASATPASATPASATPASATAASGIRGEPSAELRLLLSLGAWAVWSTGAGAVLWRLGRRDGERALGDAGRMTVAWGLVDGAVAAWGARRLRRPWSADGPAQARRMALLTGANALLDVGYVVAGGGPPPPPPPPAA